MQAKKDQAIFYYNSNAPKKKNKPSMVTTLTIETKSGHPYIIEQLQFPTSDNMCSNSYVQHKLR
jgi:hypothetical protein